MEGQGKERDLNSARSLVVSIHDVAPSTVPETQYLLDALDRIGAWPRVLKVIPHAYGSAAACDDPQLRHLLAEEVSRGSEVVLHGYTHQSAGPIQGAWPTRLWSHLTAGPSAEFLSLDEQETVWRLTRGREVLRACGLDAQGFCAPAWKAPRQLPAILRRCGFRYYLTQTTLLDLQSGRRLLIPWDGYMGAGPVHERLVGIGGRLYMALSAGCPTVKVFLHPQGAIGSRACDRVLRLLSRLVRRRRLVTYGNLLGR